MTTAGGALPVPVPLTARVERYRPEPGEFARSVGGASGGSVTGRKRGVADGSVSADERFGKGRRR